MGSSRHDSTNGQVFSAITVDAFASSLLVLRHYRQPAPGVDLTWPMTSPVSLSQPWAMAPMRAAKFPLVEFRPAGWSQPWA